MSKYANLTITIALAGGARPLRVTRAPFSAQAFPSTSPAAQLTGNSPGVAIKMQLQAGNNAITLPSQYLTGYASPYYFVLYPPAGSAVYKALRGATTDQGVALVPGMPMVYAFPPTPTPMFIWASAAELCDAVFI